MTIHPFSLSLLAALAVSGVAYAQTPPKQEQTTPDQQQPANGDAWYHQQLVDLSEVLGGTHYLNTVCTGVSDQRWRDYMRSVIQRAPQYSDELVEAFNRGYSTQQSQFPACDESAQQMETELRARGLRISQGLAARHTE